MGKAGKFRESTASMLPVLLACSSRPRSGRAWNVALPELAGARHHALHRELGSSGTWWLPRRPSCWRRSCCAVSVRRVFFVRRGACARKRVRAGSELPHVVRQPPRAGGAGFILPSVTSVIMANSPAEVRGTRLALNSGVIAVGLAVSPTVSLRAHAVRVALDVRRPLAMSAALLAVGFFRIRGGHRRSASPSTRSGGAGPARLAAFLYGLGEITHDAGPSVIALAAGAVLLALFAWRQFSLKDPLLDLHPRPSSVRRGHCWSWWACSSFSRHPVAAVLQGALGFTAFFAGLLLLGPVLVNGVHVPRGRLFDKHGA
ncbi:MAG: hypothetical protein ACLT98_08590 [Eggerthellaceae bacterium]